MLDTSSKWAVFLDIDGTLIDDNYIIPQKNLYAIAKIREMGHLVFINTGRSLGNIPTDVLEQVEVDGYITGNGSMITINGENLEGVFYTDEQVKRIAEFAFQNLDTWFIFEGVKGSYYTGNLAFPERREERVVSVSDLFEKSIGDSIQAVAFNRGVNEELFSVFSEDLTFYEYDKYYDAVRKGLNKVSGIKKALEITGISQERTIAFGDSENDLEMIKFCKIGVAVSNAQEILRDSADYVSSSNVDGGVGSALNHFFFQ